MSSDTSAPTAPRAVCVGETMAVLVPETPGPLEHSASFRRMFGGAESNVARGLAALGVPAAWLSRVGDDGFGRHITAELAAAGVDTSAVAIDEARPTGLYIKETAAGGASRMHYYRSSSAASALSPADLDTPAAAALLAGAGLVHVSGITAALSDSAHALVRHLLERPRPAGQIVSFDLNWRPALWRSRGGPSAAAEALRPLLDAADVVLLGADEAETVFGTGDAAELRRLLPGPRTVVVKDESNAAHALDRDGTATTEPALRVEVVEPVGAGDAFAAGYLAGTLRGLPQAERLRLGHLTAAATLVVPEDAGTPFPADATAELLAAPPEVWRATTVTTAGPAPTTQRTAT
ncbi:sugar kinase [Mangrovactinospora gilvigrisea]|uniref:Sugar kinase n=1 Tax=Mangrovactinospora gilvigrisea TaxID=1428644 RepID=A0A1J7CC66_9ACTN|nr:sugar kinase [Mangrovactinospora gilvigrisea]OIV39100.1 sugar kinase [Mangrovactinospora gilvigrisea]